ncbi:MAG TPA: extracellular solute-binding protein [Lachnospiraceae bacterium]|nr:extracellular solute-binding protein [Lachnospiraceae bacterium]
MRVKKKVVARCLLVAVLLFILCVTGYSKNQKEISQEVLMEQWIVDAKFDTTQLTEELYQAALEEDILTIYSVSTRVFDVKESFEKEYPGLNVEIKDVRGNDLVRMVKENYQSENYACDLVICSDCDGSLYKELLEPGIVYTYIPQDIAPFIKDEFAEDELEFLGEVLMVVYNGEAFEAPPIDNIWEMTEDIYKGKIIMASPLSSFSTYGFCATVLRESKLMEEAYEQYAGKPLELPEGKSAGEVFWEQLAENMVFTNSSDEVLEGIGNSGPEGMMLGFMISSKMRYQDIGYQIEPIYHLEPFAAVYTPNSVCIAAGSKNVNTAKLFIRYMLGELDGTGNGLNPFFTKGTWSVRSDVADGNDVPLEDIDVQFLDKSFLYENREEMLDFWEEILKKNVVQ